MHIFTTINSLEHFNLYPMVHAIRNPQMNRPPQPPLKHRAVWANKIHSWCVSTLLRVQIWWTYNALHILPERHHFIDFIIIWSCHCFPTWATPSNFKKYFLGGGIWRDVWHLLMNSIIPISHCSATVTEFYFYNVLKMNQGQARDCMWVACGP